MSERNRREFVGGILGVGACLAVRGTWAGAVVPKRRQEGIRAALLHLGRNLWCDWYPDDVLADVPAKRRPDVRLAMTDDAWRRETDYAAKVGLNMVVIDLAEGLVWPSHPELAVTGSWTVEKMRTELTRLRGMGLEPIPKLNFSATHNGWLKQYRRMLSTPTYYRVSEDLIRDVAEIFDRPRFLHIGYDEESVEQQVGKEFQVIAVRRHGQWWKDFLHIVRTCESFGMRPWAWADAAWHDWDEFAARCPKSVLLSNWFYDEAHGGFDPETNKTSDRRILECFGKLDRLGFDQVPCGTNWAGWKRSQEKVGADDVMAGVVDCARKHIAAARLKGFLMASWATGSSERNVDFTCRGMDLLAKAME